MKGFFSRLFASKKSGSSSSENEVVAAIAVALELYGRETRMAPAAVVRTAKAASGWTCKSYGMTRLPQRNRRW